MIKFCIAVALFALAPMLAACGPVQWRDPALRSGPEVGSAANYAAALPVPRLLPRVLPVT